MHCYQARCDCAMCTVQMLMKAHGIRTLPASFKRIEKLRSTVPIKHLQHDDLEELQIAFCSTGTYRTRKESSVVDPDHFGNLDPHPDLHQIKIRTLFK